MRDNRVYDPVLKNFRTPGKDPTQPGYLDADRYQWLLRCELAIKAMAAQFIDPKTTPKKMVDDILRPKTKSLLF